jgi:serine protease Do
VSFHSKAAIGVAFALFVTACGGTQKAAPQKLTAKDIVKRSTAAIVRVEAGNDKVGTGFVVDKTGIIVTNVHVVAGEAKITVRFSDGSTLPVMRIAAADIDRDLVLLDTDPASALPTLTLGDSDALSAGDAVIAIGNPLGVLDYSVSNGLVSSVRKLSAEMTVLQISAPISQGSSGGPLFNQDGEVIGITTAIITAGQNLNIAVPSNYLRPLLAQKKSRSVEELARATSGASERPTPSSAGPIERKVPTHELKLLTGCRRDELVTVVGAIEDAIKNGAPLYNDGNHEACFRIYEGTAIKFERDSSCAGVRSAFGDGLLRASTLTSPTEKAWAMRDTFDGLLMVIERWAQSQP